jgi:hypothetical protein
MAPKVSPEDFALAMKLLSRLDFQTCRTEKKMELVMFAKGKLPESLNKLYVEEQARVEAGGGGKKNGGKAGGKGRGKKGKEKEKEESDDDDDENEEEEEEDEEEPKPKPKKKKKSGTGGDGSGISTPRSMDEDGQGQKRKEREAGPKPDPGKKEEPPHRLKVMMKMREEFKRLAQKDAGNLGAQEASQELYSFDLQKAVKYVYRQNDSAENEQAVWIIGAHDTKSGGEFRELCLWDLQGLCRAKNSSVGLKQNVEMVEGGTLRKAVSKMIGKYSS